MLIVVGVLALLSLVLVGCGAVVLLLVRT